MLKDNTVNNADLTRGQNIWITLREYRKTEQVSIWRGRLQTKAYRETEGQPVLSRRAWAFETLMEELPIWIDDGQLLAGDTCAAPMSLEWFPDLAAGWLKCYLDSGESNYFLGDETIIAEMKQITDYWVKNAVKDSFADFMGQEWKQWANDVSEFGSWLIGTEGGAQTQRGWNVLNWEKAIKLGYSGIIKDIDDRLSKHIAVDSEAFRKQQFWQVLKRELKAAIGFSKRYASLARELAKEAEGQRKEDLEKIASVCSRVPEFPAENFHEAVQCLWFTYLMVYWETLSAGISMGRVDQYLYPYFKNDIARGVIDNEYATQILECLRVKCSCRRDFSDNTLRAAQSGWTLFCNCTLAGQLSDGSDAVNELSYLWLDAAERTRTPHPTLSIRYHKNIDQDFGMRAVEICSIGMGFPAWFGDKASVSYLKTKGASHEEAMDYALAGCVLTVVPHKSAPTWPLVVNMPKILELTLNDGIDPVNSKRLGPQTGLFKDFSSYEQLMHAHDIQARAILNKATDYLNAARHYRIEHLPDLFSSVFLDNCIEAGKPSFADSVKLHKTSAMYILPVGAIDTANSLAAIKLRVFEEKKITPGNLMESLEHNFEGYEEIQHLLLTAPKFGNDDDYVDFIAVQLYDWLCDLGLSIEAPFGAHYECAPHNLSFHGAMGLKTGALPSGRLAKVSLVDGAVSPCQGTDKNGPTAVISSAGKVHHDRILGTLLNMKFLPSSLKTREERRKLLALIHTYFEDYGGKHIQFNVVDRQTLLDAKAHPEKYSNLIVRVAGYSAFWVELSDAIQNDIISRTENSFS